jgi:hypothetical protein
VPRRNSSNFFVSSRATPAMAGGIADRVRSIDEMIDLLY